MLYFVTEAEDGQAKTGKATTGGGCFQAQGMVQDFGALYGCFVPIRSPAAVPTKVEFRLPETGFNQKLSRGGEVRLQV